MNVHLTLIEVTPDGAPVTTKPNNQLITFPIRSDQLADVKALHRGVVSDYRYADLERSTHHRIEVLLTDNSAIPTSATHCVSFESLFEHLRFLQIRFD